MFLHIKALYWKQHYIRSYCFYTTNAYDNIEMHEACYEFAGQIIWEFLVHCRELTKLWGLYDISKFSVLFLVNMQVTKQYNKTHKQFKNPYWSISKS